MIKFLIFSTSLILLSGCVSKNIYVDEVIKFPSRCPSMSAEERRIHNNLIPKIRYQHRAPDWAASDGVNGYVRMEFDIGPTGKVENINVLESYPSSVYVLESKNSLEKWVYEPVIKNGEVITSKCHSVQLEYSFTE